jgi:putative sigma-54 modulation protein
MDVTPALKAYALRKASKLVRYYDRITEIEVVFNSVRPVLRVEMIVNAEPKIRFLAHHDQADAYACIDQCMPKLERQLSEHKRMTRNRKHQVGTDKRAMRTARAERD